MAEEVLVRSAYELFSSIAELKRHLLYFDRIAIHDLKGFVEFHYLADQSDGTETYQDLEYLCEIGALFEPDLCWPDILNDESLRVIALQAALTRDQLQKHAASQVIDVETVSEEFMQEWGRLQGLHHDLIARLIATNMAVSGTVNAFPMLSARSASFATPSQSRANVVEMVVANLPIPDDATPWETILDYRKDPNSRKRLNALRHWINQLAHKSLTGAEVSDEIRYLLDEYESHIYLHKMKFSMGAIETVVLAGAEFLENIMKLRFSSAVRQLISLKNHKLSLLEAELKAPGRELAYLVNCRDKFETS